MKRKSNDKQLLDRRRESAARRIKFDVESLEQRLLLSANLYNPADTTGPNEAQIAIKTQIVEVFDQLGDLGDAINNDATLNKQLDETKVPLLDQTLRDITGENVGDFFNFAAGAASINNYLSGPAPTSGGLALTIQGLIDTDPGLAGTVTDLSTATALNLKIDLSKALGATGTLTKIDLDEAAEEFQLDLADTAEVSLKESRALNFSIHADLSSYASLGDSKFWVDFTHDATFHAEATHTSTTDPLTGFGVQVGVLGMRENPSGAGAYVFEGEYLLDVTAVIDFGDGAGADKLFSLAELKTFGAGGTAWTGAYDFLTPVTASTPTIVGQNTGSMTLQIRVANPTGVSTEIGGIGGIAGTISFEDNDLFDNHAPLTTADATLAAFGRLSAFDLLNMVDSTAGWAQAIQASDLYRDRLPFLDLTTGDAYAFGEAFREVFLAQLQHSEQVLTAVNAPSTQRATVQDPLDFKGGTSFMISVNGGAWATVTLSADPLRASLDSIAVALNSVLPGEVRARVTESNSPRLELVADEASPFVLAMFQPAGEGVLDLGFNTHGEVLIANNGTVGTFDGSDPSTHPEAAFRLPEIVFGSTTSIVLEDFRGPESRTITFNRNGEGAVTVSIPGHDYSSLSALAERIRDALVVESLFDTGSGKGIQVLEFNEGGVQGLRFFGSEDVFSMTIGGADLGRLGMTAGTLSAEYVDFHINGNAAETIRVYLNGNLTGDLLGRFPNDKISDLVEDIRKGLEVSSYLLDGGGNPVSLSPLIDNLAGTGIDVRGSTDSSGAFSGGIQFFARNPGTGAGKIASFEIVGQSAGLAHLGFSAGFRQSKPFVPSELFVTPNFTSVQELAARIANAGSEPDGTALRDPGAAGLPYYTPATLINGIHPVGMGFVFPISFTYVPPSFTGEDAISVDLEKEYGEINLLRSESKVDVDRSVTSSFKFEVNLIPDMSTPEVLEVEIPVFLSEWNGQLTQDDAVFTLILDDGVEHNITITSDSTVGNASTQDFVDQLSQSLLAIGGLSGKVAVSLDTDADTGLESIVFSTDPAATNTRMFQVLVRPEVAGQLTVANAAVTDLKFSTGKTTVNSVTAEIRASSPPSSITLDSHAILRFSLFDGNVGDVVLFENETADNASLQDLVDDLNIAIAQTLALSTVYEGKILAFIDDTDPLAPRLAFKLNPEVFPANGTYTSQSWSLEVFPDYVQNQPNGAFSELEIRERNTASSDRDVPLSVVSGAFSGNDPFRLTHPAQFDVSINGSEYVTVSVPAMTGLGTPTMGDLIAAINGALATPDITIGVQTFKLSDFLRATTFGDGTRLAIISLDNTNDPGKPNVLTFRVAPDLGDPNNGALTTLGFLQDEQRIAGRGGQLFLESIRLTGQASVTSQPVTATGSFGFIEFQAGDGSLDLVADITTTFRDGLREKFSFQELSRLVTRDDIGIIATTGVEPATFATLELSDLSFPVDPETGTLVGGLAFGPHAKITLSHALTGLSDVTSITDFGNLPAPALTYTDTLGMEKLHSLGFEDVVNGLLRTAEFVMDQMALDPDGDGPAKNAFAERLLFVKDGLADVFDLGAAFFTAVSKLRSAPPRTLQDLQKALVTSLGLQGNAGQVLVSVETEYDSPSGGNLTQAYLSISLPFLKAFEKTLPLFVDLLQLRNRSKNPALVGEGNGYLEGIDALVSPEGKPINVEIAGESRLKLDLGIEVVKGGVTVEPRAVLKDTTEIETSFNLSGEGLNGDLSVGVASLRLSNGKVAISASGEVAVEGVEDNAVYSIDVSSNQILPYEVKAATTSSLDADYLAPNAGSGVGASLRAKINQSINSVESTLADGITRSGVDGVDTLKVNDLILVKNQVVVDGKAYQNGIYRVKEVGSGGPDGIPWEIVRVGFADETGATDPGEFSELRVRVALGEDNGGVRFIQENSNLASLSSGSVVSFSSDLERVYSNFNPATPGVFERSAVIHTSGQAKAYLPLLIVVKDENGREVVITKDTSRLSEADAANSAIVAALPDFVPLNVRVLNQGAPGDAGYGSGLGRLYDPTVAAPVVFYSVADSLAYLEMPALSRNLPATDVLKLLRDPFLMGEALDLSLVNLQFAIDQVLGNEIPLLGLDLPTYTPFIEEWRTTFTGVLRDNLRLNPLKPINAVLDALFEVLGPGGMAYLSDRNAEIKVETLSASGLATIWNPANQANYGLNPLNQKFEKVPLTAVGLQFSLHLMRALDAEGKAINIERVDLDASETGLEIDTRTVFLTPSKDVVDTTGGVNLRRSFDLHLGFGVDVSRGFFLFNPRNTGPTALAPSDSHTPPIMSIGIEAVLDGDIHKVGIQQFIQKERYSKLHDLDIKLADAADVPGDRKSGFYGTFDFFLNTGTNSASPGQVSLQDIQKLKTLGLDRNSGILGDLQSLATVPLLKGIPISLNSLAGIFSSNVNGDADIHLLIEGGRDGTSFGEGGGIPTIQAEFFLDHHYGTGSSLLSYTDMAAGAKAASDAVKFGTPTELQKYQFDHLPEFRYHRNLLTGTKIAFTNLTLDAEGFLKGTIFESLLKFSDTIRPIRPTIDFLLTPVPGTEWFAEPFVLGDLLGAKFLRFIQAVTRLDDMIRAIGEGITFGQETKPEWAKPRVQLGAAGNIFWSVARYDNAAAARETVAQYAKDRDESRRKAEQQRIDDVFDLDDLLNEKKPTSDRTVLQKMKESLDETVLTPNKYSLQFEAVRDKGFAIKTDGYRVVNYLKKRVNSALNQSDDRPGQKAPIVGLSGGGFRLDYLKAENIQKILRGEPANLSYLELPRLELGISYRQSFPLPAFPPLVLTVGTSISINANFKFGWDTQGFYWSTLDTAGNQTPAFGVLARFSVGVALNFGLIEAGIEAFFELQVDFNWNDVTVDAGLGKFEDAWLDPVDTEAFPYPETFGNRNSPDFGKLRNQQIEYLKSLPGGTNNLFDVTLTGRVGLTLYVDLVIPVPLVGPITKRILEQTYSIDLFQFTFFGTKPTIQLASQEGNALNLNVGEQAKLRLFANTSDRNEVFTLLSEGAGTGGVGEKIRVQAVLSGVTYLSDLYDQVTRVKGVLGSGQSQIDASRLMYALVDLKGGSGNSILKAGMAGTSGNNRSRLTGGTGTSTLYGAPAASSILVAGSGSTTIYGGSKGDDITSGVRSDVLVGGGGGDIYRFINGFGRDQLIVTGRGNIADFSQVNGNLTVNLGRLVQSAKVGLNTMFFTPDGAGTNSIDTWITGPGDDRFNTYYFPPAGASGTKLNLNGGGGNNFYAVTLGNPLQRFYTDVNPGAATEKAKMDPRNIGTIQITDPTGNGHMLIKQVFPEGISYDLFHVDNVREQVTMRGFKTVDLDAGNSTVVWGAPGVEWINLGSNSTITAGTIEMVSNVEADGLILKLKRNFEISKILHLRNDSDLEINLQNIDPLASSNLLLGPSGAILSSSKGVFYKTRAVEVPAVAGATVGGIPNGSGFSWISYPGYLTSTPSVTIPGLVAVSAPPQDVGLGYPAFTVPGRAAITIPGRSAFSFNGIDYAEVPAFVVPAVDTFVYAGGSGAFTIPAVAQVVIPEVPGPGGRPEITIPGRSAIPFPALPATVQNSPLGDRVVPEHADGAGAGTIRINAPTGGVLNSPDGAGLIQALNGNVVIDVRDTIGFDSSPVKINSKHLAAVTRKAVGTLAQGINVVSDHNVDITAIDGIDGLSTLSGRIWVAVAPGKTITYGNILAGDSRDIILEADKLQLGPARQGMRTEVGIYYEDVPYTYTYTVPVPHTVELGPLSYTYYTEEERTFTVVVEVARFGAHDVPFDIPAGGGIDTRGQVYLRNVTNNLAIRVGDSLVTLPNTLHLTVDVLNSITSNASAILIGRNKEEAIRTGVATVLNYVFKPNTSLVVKASQISVPGVGAPALSSTSSLEFQAYEGSGSGAISFVNGSGSSSVQAPTILATAFRDITVDTTLTSTMDDGLIRLIAGFGASGTGGSNNTGSLTITAGGQVSASHAGSSVVLKSGSGSGDILIGSSVEGFAGLDLEALGGSITVTSPARLIGDKLTSVSVNTSSLRTTVREITSARVLGVGPVGGQNLVINESNDVDLIYLETGANAGFIDVTAAGQIYLVKIDATDGNNVTLDAQGGSITSSQPPTNDFNVRANTLVATAWGEIIFDSKVNELVADALALGGIVVNNVGGESRPLLVTRAEAADGLIQIETDGDLTARLVRSLNSAAGNDITLRTRELFGGDIVVDRVDAGAFGDVRLEAGSFTPNPATGLPVSGGTIISDPGTTNRVTARELVALARGYPAYPETLGIDLRTDVADLIARTFTGGDVSRLDSRVDIRIDELDDVRLRWMETFSGDITVTTPGTITHQAVRAPNRDIFLTASAGSILEENASVTIDGQTLPPKIFGRDLDAQALNVLTLNTAVDSLRAASLLSGTITITESDSVRLESVTTAHGDIDITVGEFANGAILIGGNAEVGLIRAGSAGNDDVKLTVYGQAISSGRPGTPLIDPAFVPFVNAKIHADLLEVASYGRLDLVTNVDRLIGENFSIGNVTINEDDAIDVTRLVSDRGRIDLTAGGTITARLVESKTDISQASTFDIDLHATSGDVLVDWVWAGTENNDLFITADTGSIEEVDPQDADDSFDHPAMSGIDVIADHAVLNAWLSIGGVRPIETQFNVLTAHSLSLGNIDLNEHDAITLLNADTADGSITINAGGTITALDVRSLVDRDANDVTLHNTDGDILIDVVDAGSVEGDLYLTSDAGSIEEVDPEDADDRFDSPATAGIDLIADQAVLNAFHSIGGERPLETRFNTLEAHSLDHGNIDIHEHDAITLLDVDTADGGITIDAGGTIIAEDVQSLTDREVNDISLHNTTGNILLGKVWAQRTFSDIFLTSDSGGIDELAPEDADVDLQGDQAVIRALTSIGGIRPIETELNRLSAEVTGAGNIVINEQTGIRLDLVKTTNGSITLTALGNIEAVDVRTGADSVANGIYLTVGGVLAVDEIIAGSNSFRGQNPARSAPVVLNAARIVELGSDSTVDIRGATLDLMAGSGIGQLGNPLEISGSVINSTTRSGPNALNNYSSGPVLVTSLSSGSGGVFFEQFGGTITFNSVSTGSGDISLFMNGGGNMLVNSVSTGKGNLSLTVHGGGRLQVVRTSIRGNALFQADEMDFLGGPASLFGTGVLTIKADNPGVIILVNPYGELGDEAGVLEIDINALLAIAFPIVNFVGKVIFVLPVLELPSLAGQLGNISIPGLNQGEGEGDVFFLVDLLRNGSGDGLLDGDELQRQALARQLVVSLGYSPFALTGLGDSIPEMVFSGLLRLGDWQAVFAAFFGYHPLGLEGLMPDLFDRLAESLQADNAPSNFDPPTSQMQEAPSTGGARPVLNEPQWAVSRGEAPDMAVPWESGQGAHGAESPTAMGALQMLPVAFSSFANKMRRRFKPNGR